MFLDKKILLHVGYPKSLSTTLQKNIFPNISKIKNIDFINKKRTQNRYFHVLKSISEKNFIKDKFKNDFKKNTIISHEGFLNFEKNYDKENAKLLFDFFENNVALLIVIRKPSELHRSNFIHKIMELEYLSFEDYRKNTDYKKFDVINNIEDYLKYFNNIIVVKAETLLSDCAFYKELFNLSEKQFSDLTKDKKNFNRSFSNLAIKFTIFMENLFKIFGFSLRRYKNFLRNINDKNKPIIISFILKRAKKYFQWRYLIQNIFDKLIPSKKFTLDLDDELKDYFDKLDNKYDQFSNYKIFKN